MFQVVIEFVQDTYLHILLLIVILLVFHYHRKIITWKRRKDILSKIPIAPGSIPFIGHLFTLIKGAPWDIITTWSLNSPGIMRIHLLGSDMVVVRDRELIKTVLSSKFLQFHKDLTTYSSFLCLLGTGLVTSEGDLWRQQRAKIAPALKIEILEGVADITKQATNMMTKDFITQIKSSNQNKVVFEMGEEFRKLTLQVIGASILSLPFSTSNRIFPSLYLPIVEESNLLVWYPFRKFLPLPATIQRNRAIGKLNQYVVKLIQDRYDEMNKGNCIDDVLSRILTEEKKENWGKKTITQLRDEIKTFLFAGHETSSTMLTWALYEICKNEEIKKKATKEAEDMFGAYYSHNQLWENDNVIEEGEEDVYAKHWPSYDTLRNGLPYITACLKEALRKYSIVPIVTREAAVDTELGDYKIPKGTQIAIPIQAVHYDPNLWPDPASYIPERWEEEESRGEAWKFIGFLAGPRSCAGQYFALLESKIVIAILLLHFNFEIPAENHGTRHSRQIPLSPVDRMRLVLSPRK